MIDQHHFLSSTNQEFTGEMFAGQQSEIERNILRKKFKMDQEAKKMAMVSAIIN